MYLTTALCLKKQYSLMPVEPPFSTATSVPPQELGFMTTEMIYFILYYKIYTVYRSNCNL